MAGFGGVWAAVVVIVLTPLLGGFLTYLAYKWSANETRVRAVEKRLAVTVCRASQRQSVASNGSDRTADTRDQQFEQQFMALIHELKNLNQEVLAFGRNDSLPRHSS